jgi:hypothetical protein
MQLLLDLSDRRELAAFLRVRQAERPQEIPRDRWLLLLEGTTSHVTFEELGAIADCISVGVFDALRWPRVRSESRGFEARARELAELPPGDC